MVHVLWMELENFKIFQGVHKLTLGQFNVVLGQNGKDKTSLLEAFIFVFGAQVNELHIRGLKGLTYAPQRKDLSLKKTCSVAVKISINETSTMCFTRKVINNSSQYWINYTIVQRVTYLSELTKIGIESNKIFSIINQMYLSTLSNPTNITELIEHISGYDNSQNVKKLDNLKIISHRSSKYKQTYEIYQEKLSKLRTEVKKWDKLKRSQKLQMKMFASHEYLNHDEFKKINEYYSRSREYYLFKGYYLNKKILQLEEANSCSFSLDEFSKMDSDIDLELSKINTKLNTLNKNIETIENDIHYKNESLNQLKDKLTLLKIKRDLVQQKILHDHG